jgi:hypothetical protein
MPSLSAQWIRYIPTDANIYLYVYMRPSQGAIWLLEAAYMLPENASNPLGAKELSGSKSALSIVLESYLGPRLIP